MNMKTTAIIIAAALTITACASEKKGNTAPETTQAVATTPSEAAAKGFTAIVTKGHYDIFYTQGSTTSVELRGNTDAINNTDISCDGRTLTIAGKNRRRLNIGNNGDVDVYITSPSLGKVSINGSGDFKSESDIKSDNMEISISGSGDAELRSLDCTECRLSIAGSGDIGVDRIKAKRLEAKIAGSGDIDLSNADISNAECSIAGSGDIDIDGRVGSCSKRIAGSGRIDINP